MKSSAIVLRTRGPAFCRGFRSTQRLGLAATSAAFVFAWGGAASAQAPASAEDTTSPEASPLAENRASAQDPVPSPRATPTSDPAAAKDATSASVEDAATDDAAPGEGACDPDLGSASVLPTGSAEAAEGTPLSPEQARALRPLSWKRSPGQGVSFGLEEGLWGHSWGQGLRTTIPFNRYLGVTLRGLYLIDMRTGPFTSDAGGRLDFVGRSDVFYNVVRLYGGGGVQVLAPATNTAGRQVEVGVGGHFGFEFFHSPHFSYFLEIGGQGGAPSPGATVMAGLNLYPWTR